MPIKEMVLDSILTCVFTSFHVFMSVQLIMCNLYTGIVYIMFFVSTKTVTQKIVKIYYVYKSFLPRIREIINTLI